jgi:hypothetical protein
MIAERFVSTCGGHVAHPALLDFREEIQTAEAMSRRLRISLTSSCNFACFFCHNEGQGALTPQQSSTLGISEYLDIASAALDRGVTQIKLTGGEPLLYRDGTRSIVDLVASIASLRSRHDFELSMKTNGVSLPKYAAELRIAGLDRVTISIHALGVGNHAAFIAKVPSSKFFSPALALDAARTNNLGPVKVNTVLFGDSIAGSVSELDGINRLALEYGVSEVRLYTIIDADRIGVPAQWLRRWSDGLAEEVGSTLFDAPQAGAFARRVRAFVAADSPLLQRRSVRISGAIDYVIDAMEPERFGAIGLTDEGPYAIRLAADGTLRAYLNGDGALQVNVRDETGHIRSASGLKSIFEQSQDSFRFRLAG